MTLVFPPNRWTLFYLLRAVHLCKRAIVAQYDSGEDDDADNGVVMDGQPNRNLIYLTLSNNSDKVNVNFISADVSDDFKYTVKEGRGSGRMSHTAEVGYNISNAKLSSLQCADDLTVRSASLKAPKDGDDITYSISKIAGDNQKVPIGGSDSPTNLTVCVFGDYRSDLYNHIALNLSQFIGENGCNLNLFIGKIVWEQRGDGFAFNPHLQLHDDDGRHFAFAKVPSIFGAVGSGLNETTFFDSTEVNGVAFIQTTVTLVTVANISSNLEQFNKVEEYFRETMLNELECKLQELYKRKKKPWIVVYLTHPSLYKEHDINWLLLNSVDRFFEILKRYKIDLLMSCGIEGMTKILKDRRSTHPDEQLPIYIQTTLAECGGYMAFAPTVQNECSYTVLNISKSTMGYEKKDSDGKVLESGLVEKNKEEPDKCVEHEL